MTPTAAILVLAGVALGIGHGAALWTMSRRPAGPVAALGALRLLVTGTVLVSVALLGGILPVSAGFFAGLGATVLLGARQPHRSARGDERARQGEPTS